MEPNQNKTDQNTQKVQAPVAPPAPAAQVPPPPPPAQSAPPQNTPVNPNQPIGQQASKKGENKMILFSVIGVLLITLVLLLYLFSSKFIGSNRSAEVSPIPQKTIAPSQPVSQIESGQTNNADLGNPEEDLKSIEQDLNQL